MYDVAIIGGGIAGMTAAIYARRASKSVLVLEKTVCGGQIINSPDIENYPAAPHISGYDLADRTYKQAKELGAEFRFENAEKIENENGFFAVVSKKARYEAKSVIIAVGSENRKLGLENEDKLTGRGVSYCATCDGFFFRGKTVAVVGGGNTALDDALYLSDVAKKVYLIHRRDSFRGENSTFEKLKSKDNVEFVYNSVVDKLIADEKLTGVEVKNKNGMTAVIEIDGLFVAIGRTPENSPFEDLIDLDDAGYALSGENCRTRTPGIFVAGDNRAKEIRQLVTAASDGAVAASEAVRYLSSL